MSLFFLIFFAGAPVEVPDVDILSLSDEMRQFLNDNLRASQDPKETLQALTTLVFSDSFLNLSYDVSKTQTASETFATRTGNCLSFTNMFIAMAREVGLNASYQEVKVLPNWERHGDMIVYNRHINAVVKIGPRRFQIDYNTDLDRDGARNEIVPDERAKAQYYNNLGVEAFGRQEYDLSLALFHKALEIQSDIAFVWANIGVVESARGQLEQAEDAYMKALAIDEEELMAISNLAKLYQKKGKISQAKYFFGKAEKFLKKNPYYHFNFGERAFAKGDYQTALTHYRRAVKRKTDEYKFHFALARAYTELGQNNKAEQVLKRASKYAPKAFGDTVVGSSTAGTK